MKNGFIAYVLFLRNDLSLFSDNIDNLFQDVVDFTVGWYIEPEQPIAVLDKCHQMLVELRPYWHSAVPAAITLMKQFLDDASAYIEVVPRIRITFTEV